MKIAPIIRELNRRKLCCQQILVHTGQHYDENMSGVFFSDLGLPWPDVNLEVGSGSHASQTAQVMIRFEPVVRQFNPDVVIVPGDVNSTLACALVCSKLGIKIAHVEAGLRSFDRTMPEEINRVVVDHISDILFVPSIDAIENLRKEGIDEHKIKFVGNVMIDSLEYMLPTAAMRWTALQSHLGVEEFILVTLHRPSNVDDINPLREILNSLIEVTHKIPVVFPVHPRTRKHIDVYAKDLEVSRLKLIEPLGYTDFLAVESHAKLVITDSGGVQEETTFLHIPCITIRDNTERPVTITNGTNRLVRPKYQQLLTAIQESMQHTDRLATLPELWDGNTSSRLIDHLISNVSI